MSIIQRIFPFVTWFKGYDLAALRADGIAGLTVALVLVPQSMAYAQLAGLPPYYGLYAAFLPPMVASLFGSSRQLATGPVAIVSLMTAATLEPLATAGSEAYVAYALLLALAVGLFQLALGVLRLGLVVNFLSHPVVNGFTNAAAIIIATSQLSKIFGVYVEKAPHHYETVWRVIVAALERTHWPTVGMAALSFATMIILKRVNPRIPNVLVAVVVTTLLAWAIGFEHDEAVPIERLVAPAATERIDAFNEAVGGREALEGDRTAAELSWSALEADGANGCRSCHDDRELALFAAGREEQVLIDRSGQALLLHGRAGLFDQHIGALKQVAGEHRTALREMLFVKATLPGEVARFYPQDQAPRGAAVEDRLWHLKVGNKRLAPERLVFSGGGAVVATIPEGLPALSLPKLDWQILPRLFLAAIIISLLGFMEAISIAKAMAARTRQKLDANQELIGQGLANIIGCIGQSYAVSGSFSRSAVNLQAGGRTGLSNVFSSVVVVIVLLFLSGGLYHLPQAVLASIIMMAVFGLIGIKGFMHAWQTSRFDGTVSVLTFVGTLIFAPHLENGIFIGISLSLIAYLYRSMRPGVRELAPHPDGSMRDASREGLAKCKHIAMVSFEGPLNFASTSYLEGEILARVAELPELKQLIISANGISEMDASGEETLRSLVENLHSAGYQVGMSGTPETIMDVLKRSHLDEVIGAENFYATRAQAIATIFAATHEGEDEPDCPYRQAMPPVVELSQHADGTLRSVERHDLPTCDHIAVLRFDAPLNFANTGFLEQEILQVVSGYQRLRYILFVGHGINLVDESGAKKLADLVTKLRGDGFAVAFSGLKDEVLEVLERTDVLDVIKREMCFPTQARAIAGLYASAHAGSAEADCPLWDLAPHLVELSLHDSRTFRQASRHHLKLCDHLAVLRLEGNAVLASQPAIKSEFMRWVKRRANVNTVIFLLSAIERFDSTQAENLLGLIEEVREAGLEVALANVNDRALEDLGRSGVADAIGLDHIYPSATGAVISRYTQAHDDDDVREESCALAPIIPRLVEISLHADGSLRDARRHGLALCERVAAVRFDGDLNLATIGYFEGALREMLARRASVKHVLIAGHTLSVHDSTAAEELPAVFGRLRDEGYGVHLSGLRDDDLEILKRAIDDDKFGSDGVYPTQAKAIAALHGPTHEGCAEDPCPLMAVVPAAETKAG